jgi:glycosyltransferase involved in cell wall biosynthesis
VYVAPNGIDPARFRFDPDARARARARLGIPADAYVVGGVGRQVPGKHFDTLIRAVAATAGMHLVLAGDGPERVPLLRLVQGLGVQDRVRLTDSESLTGVPALLSAADLFVSPSAEEAFGLAVVEALAAGLPTLYVACPALEDLPPQDAPGARRVDPGSLVAALREEHLAGQRRLPVPAAVARYDIGQTAEDVMTLYTRIAGRRRLFRRATQPAPVPRPARETTPVRAKAASTPAQATAPEESTARSAAHHPVQPAAQPAAKK